MTPLIDVVFLLLIFFMVSTTFNKNTHISIDLPEANANVIQTYEKQVEVTITRSGHYAVNDVALVDNTVSVLKSAITKVSGGNNTIPLVITADSATPHQSVVTAMDAAGQLGFTHLSITTRNTGEQDI